MSRGYAKRANEEASGDQNKRLKSPGYASLDTPKYYAFGANPLYNGSVVNEGGSQE